jgi:hypothetical protein
MMDDVIKVGDSICCHDYNDMMCVLNELMQQGYMATAEVGYVVRIQSVPIRDEIEADGFITRL